MLQLGNAFSNRKIKWGLCTKVVPDKPDFLSGLDGRLTEFDRAPERNDVMVAEIVEINRHKRLELECGRRCHMHVGDYIVVAFGHRYATNQYEGTIPGLQPLYDLLSMGGVCGQVLGKPEAMESPTTMRPIGYLAGEDGRVVNLRDYAARPLEHMAGRAIPTVVVVGSSMDAGKSTAAASLVKGLKNAGSRVCAGKLTGTAAGKDIWLMLDAGAVQVMDFTSVGHAATARCEEVELIDLYQTIWSHLAAEGPDYIVLEIADGLPQRETTMLLNWFSDSAMPIKMLCAVGDSVAVTGAVQYLERLNVNLMGISGRVTITPLSAREARDQCEYPVWSSEELADPMIRTVVDVSDSREPMAQPKDETIGRIAV